MTQHTLLQILPTSEKVEIFARAWIEHQRVDRKIPTAGRFPGFNPRIELNLETLVAGGHLRIAARQAEIPLPTASTRELDHAK